MIRRLLQPVYVLYVIITFVASIILVLPFVIAFSVGNNLTSRKAIHITLKVWSIVWLWTIGMGVKTTGKWPGKGSYVVVANHVSYIDAVVILSVIKGYFRPLGKKEISAIPVIGFIYKQIVVMVDRSSHASRSKSMRLMWRVIKHEGSILIFPEGTFNESDQPLKSFYDGAFRLAITTQTPIIPMVFHDTKDRWHYSAWWKLWPGKNRACILPAVPVTGHTLDTVAVLKQEVYNIMEQEILRGIK